MEFPELGAAYRRFQIKARSIRNSRNDKFTKKQESFFANGSDKFYETIKEKFNKNKQNNRIFRNFTN